MYNIMQHKHNFNAVNNQLKDFDTKFILKLNLTFPLKVTDQIFCYIFLEKKISGTKS